MTNWKNIHPDFVKDSGWEITATKKKLTYQELWETWGFTAKEIRQLINTGLHPNETSFGLWLKEKKESNSLTTLDTKKLRKEYNWTDIHPDFAEKDYWGKTYQQKWKELDITHPEAQELIQVGFKPNNYYSVSQWKDQGFDPTTTKEWIAVGFELNEAEEAKQWKNQGFTSQEVQQWLRKNLNKRSACFAKFLLDKGYTPLTFTDDNALNELLGEYLKNTNDWRIIHKGFC